MKPFKMEAKLDGIRNLLSNLYGEVTGLEQSYSEMLVILRKLEGICQVDDLTGLMRRNSFFSKWEKLLEECQSLNQSSGLLLIDIDHFKQVNDTHGHPTGDEVIARVADLLKQYQSPDCLIGRYGGEEFVVAIRGTDAQTLATAEMIRRNVERLHGPVLDGEGKSQANVEWKCTVSVGMVSTRENRARNSKCYDATRLLKEADEALYTAKRKGRNQVRAA